MNDKLSGIERELVVQYLVDGNVPVTLSLFDKSDSEFSEKTLTSNFFPVVIKDNMNVKQSGIIIIENPPLSVMNFAGKKVKVEFYFNRLGLFFVTTLIAHDKSVQMTIPAEICRIKDVVEEKKYDFSAQIYYDLHNSEKIAANCVPWSKINLFTKPVWKDVPLENQKKAKSYLEKFVNLARTEKNIGYGIQLIPVCNFLTDDKKDFESVENRKKDFVVLYIDNERIVLGNEGNADNFSEGNEFGIKLSFSIKEGPVKSRDIFVTARVNKIYQNEEKTHFCADLKYTSIQEEDSRYLYEKSKNELFV